MMDFLITNMSFLQNFETLQPPHGLEEAHVVHRLGPDQYLEVPQPSRPKLDRGRPPREGFGSISPKTREEIGNKNYQFIFIVIRRIGNERLGKKVMSLVIASIAPPREQ